MKRSLVLVPVAALLGLAGCTQAQISSASATAAADIQKVEVQGQLYCAKATADGPLVVALADAAGVPVLATGAAAALVKADCAAIDGIAVSPPANPGAAPVVSVTLPK